MFAKRLISMIGLFLLQLHRACAVIAWCCTAAAFVIIFVHVGGLTQVGLSGGVLRLIPRYFSYSHRKCSDGSDEGS